MLRVLVVGGGFLVLAAGCGTGGADGPSWPRPSPGAYAAEGNPFEAVSMRIHPLTHVERPGSGGASGGGPRIICFIEMRDRWYDPTKAVGSLELQLFRPGAQRGQEQQDARWQIDLSDLDRNAELYDPVTRAYRLQLDVPAWIGEPGANNQVKLRAVFVPAGPEGQRRTLRDDFVVQG